MYLKTRVPDCNVKHIVQDFEHEGKTLWADITEIKRAMSELCSASVYRQDDIGDFHFVDYFSIEELKEFGVNAEDV